MSARHFLELKFCDQNFSKTNAAQIEGNFILPFGNSPLLHAPIKNAKLLTKGEDVKSVFELHLNLNCENGPVEHIFNPGDTIGIIPQNSEDEVRELLDLLNLNELADKTYSLIITPGTTKKNLVIPKHIPQSGTIRNTMMNCLDIRGPPSKGFLKMLLHYNSSENDKEQLMLITSPKETVRYIKFIEKGRTIVDTLKVFKSSKPPIERIFEYLPPMKPRIYSISSSPLVANELSITFTVVYREDGMRGLCTSFLEKEVKNFLSGGPVKHIPFYFRRSSDFILSLDLTNLPVIMIGAGSGISPFIGFLQHICLQNLSNTQERWLFYGCRYSDRDFLYKDDIKNYLEQGTLTKFFPAFSRDCKTKQYVSDRIEENGREFVDMLVKRQARVYVCGDVKNMIPNVRETIVSVLVRWSEFNTLELAENFMLRLESTKQYVQEKWR